MRPVTRQVLHLSPTSFQTSPTTASPCFNGRLQLCPDSSLASLLLVRQYVSQCSPPASAEGLCSLLAFLRVQIHFVTESRCHLETLKRCRKACLILASTPCRSDTRNTSKSPWNIPSLPQACLFIPKASIVWFGLTISFWLEALEPHCSPMPSDLQMLPTTSAHL
jgi:hypothetical protein